jgi:outer membrane protein OmpA-like peptidoglycan-associated protein
MTRASLIFLVLFAVPASALELDVANAIVTRVQTSPASSVRLPAQPWNAGTLPPQVEGAIRRRVLRISGGSQTTLQLLEPLRDQLVVLGYEEVFGCANAACGGFDFRFQLDLLGEPEMHVDLGDFRYYLARVDRSDGAPRIVSIVTSRSSDSGFIHITEVFDSAPTDQITTTLPTPPELPHVSNLISTLQSDGRAVLEDLDFTSGADTLSDGTYPSLKSLAAWLMQEPTARIVLVGHTDAVGSLEANTGLSRRRAEAVANRLSSDYSVDPTQLQAAGVGYLAPRASNLTEDGRAQNRRVEVILLSLGG